MSPARTSSVENRGQSRFSSDGIGSGSFIRGDIMGRVLCKHCDSGTSDSYSTCEWCASSLKDAEFLVVGISKSSELATTEEKEKARAEMMTRPPAPTRKPIAPVDPPRPPASVGYGAWGVIRPALICPHCGQGGGVQTKQVRRKQGVSGGKATAALLTAGISLFATGLSRKEQATRAHCVNCESTWFF